MNESGYYPSGAEFDPKAPWNEREIPERQFDVCISQTLSKSTSVTTKDYALDGMCINTSETDWGEAYKKEHLTPLQLIERYKSFLSKHLPDPVVDIKGFKEFKYLIRECENWVNDETEIIEE